PRLHGSGGNRRPRRLPHRALRTAGAVLVAEVERALADDNRVPADPAMRERVAILAQLDRDPAGPAHLVALADDILGLATGRLPSEQPDQRSRRAAGRRIFAQPEAWREHPGGKVVAALLRRLAEDVDAVVPQREHLVP